MKPTRELLRESLEAVIDSWKDGYKFYEDYDVYMNALYAIEMAKKDEAYEAYQDQRN